MRIVFILRLSISLAKTNFKLRNEGSYLGLLWYILNPFALFFIILFVKDSAFGGHDIPFYPVYLLVGLLMFNLFIHIVGSSISVIPSNAGFIKSVKIPVEALVLEKAFQALFSHIFEILLLCACLLYVGLPLTGIILYIFILFFFFLFVAGVSFLCATFGAYISDLGNVWLVASHLLFFLTPIFYIPVEDSLLYRLNLYNPLYYFVTAGRQASVYIDLPTSEVSLFGALFSVSIFTLGLFIFGKYKAQFAELV